MALLGYLIRRERARFLAQRNAIEERARAEQATQAKSDFLSAMSHEIRTPLNGVLGILQLVQHADVPADVAHKLKVARDSGFYLLALVNQILDFSRIEAGAIQSVPERFKLDQLLDGVSSLFRQQAEEKGLTYTVQEAPADTPELIGDYTHIRQILFNLIGNAVKFTDRGSVSVSTAIEAVHGDRATLRLAVSDTGPGVPEELQELIFERFGQTGHGASKGGAGLGLSIASKLAQHMGARLAIDSRPGHGTVFTVSVPVEFAPAVEEAPHADNPAVALTPLRVLVAEDNAVNMAIITQMLAVLGHTAVSARNGREAMELAIAPDARFDLALMDVQMPEMDGVTATQAIRKSLSAEALPIVALTANAFAEQRATYLDAGMQDVLTKPLRESALVKTLARFSRERSPASEEAAATSSVPTPSGAQEMLDLTLVSQLLRSTRDEQLTEMLDLVRRETERLCAELDGVQGQAIAAAKLHELKGMLKSFGLRGAAAKCADIEGLHGYGSDGPAWRNALAELRVAAEVGMAAIEATSLSRPAAPTQSGA